MLERITALEADLQFLSVWLNHGPVTPCYCDVCGAKRLPDVLALIDQALGAGGING